MTILKQVPMRLRNKMGKTGVVLSKHAPAIFTGVGICMMTSATVVAFNNAHEAEKAVEWYRDRKDECGSDIEENELTASFVKCEAKLLLPVVGLQVGGAIFVAAGARINAKRIKTLGAIAASTAAEFAAYRGRVIEDQGGEADQRYLRGEAETTRMVQHTTPKGKVKEKEETVVIPNPEEHSQWAFQLKYGDGAWAQSEEYLLTNLKNCQDELNRQLHSRGFIFLNQVYDLLGVNDLVLDKDGTQRYVPKYTQEGQLVGWIDDGIEGSQIDFGIDWEAVRDHCPWGNVVYQNDGSAFVWLEPNVQGVIIDKI